MPKKQKASSSKGGSRRRKQYDSESDEDNAADKHYENDYRKPRLVEDGNVSSDEDEEISEDEAFNSDDERQFGSLFSKKKSGSGGSKKKSGMQLDSSDDDDSGSDDGYSESEDDGIASDDDDEEGDGGQYVRKLPTYQYMFAVEEYFDSMGFVCFEWLQLFLLLTMSLLITSLYYLQQMLDLLNNLDKGTPSKQKNEASSQLAQSSSRLAESEFSSTGVKNAGLTLDSLMGGIADTKGFGRVQKAFKDIASVPTADGKSDDGKKVLETTKAPVAKIVSERASRKVHYEEASGDVKRGTGVVKQNREAETLDFRPKDKMNIDREDLVGKFEATTDFEKEVADALEKAGAESEKDIARRERAELMGEDGADADINADDDDAMAALDDDLGGNRISLEEYKKRHGELAKMRALMFYEEQKRHHINKIKSKKYRKIRKKQRERRSEAEKIFAAR